MDNENETQVDSNTSGKRDPKWKYARLPNENIWTPSYEFFCDKVTKWSIYRHKKHLVGGYRNAKKCRSENVNEYLFGLEYEDFSEEINSRMNVTNISSGGSNQGESSGRMFSSKKPRQKGLMDHFFSTPNVKMVVQNWKRGKMNQTTINDAYKRKQEKEFVCLS